MVSAREHLFSQDARVARRLIASTSASLAILTGCLVGCSSPARHASSKPAPKTTVDYKSQYFNSIGPCNVLGHQFDAAVTRHRHYVDAMYGDERSTAAAYVSTCRRVADQWLRDQWPAGQAADFEHAAQDLLATTQLMQQFAEGKVTNVAAWLSALNSAKHVAAADLSLLHADLGLS